VVKEPTVAALALETADQPRVGVLILVMLPATAETALELAQVAATVTDPFTSIIMLAGRF